MPELMVLAPNAHQVRFAATKRVLHVEDKPETARTFKDLFELRIPSQINGDTIELLQVGNIPAALAQIPNASVVVTNGYLGDDTCEPIVSAAQQAEKPVAVFTSSPESFSGLGAKVFFKRNSADVMAWIKEQLGG
jgi:hypothetical protein